MKHVIDTGSDVNCFAFSKERLSVLLSNMTEGDVQHASSRTHGQAGGVTDGTIVDTHCLRAKSLNLDNHYGCDE